MDRNFSKLHYMFKSKKLIEILLYKINLGKLSFSLEIDKLREM